MRILSILTAGLLAVSGVVADDLKFAIYGDWGVGQNFIYKDAMTVRGASLTQAQVGHLMSLTEASVVSQFQSVSDTFRPQFILSTGDQFYDDGLFNRTDPQFQDKFKNVYTSQGVNVTWYPCLGNHDYYQDPNAELNRTMDDWRWYFPSKYYNFSWFADDGSEALFVVMDVTPGLVKYRKESDLAPNGKYYHKQLVQNLQQEKLLGTWPVQLAWAESVLNSSTAKWKFVMAHEPLYATYGTASAANVNTFYELQQQLQPILERTNVSAVFSGHFHTLDITEHNNIAYIISGAASQIPYPVGNATKEGIIDYFNQNNITGVYDPNLANVTPAPPPNGTTTRYPPEASAPNPAKPQKQFFMGGNENNLPGFMNARLNSTHLSIDVWGMYDNHTWAIVYQYTKLRIDLITPDTTTTIPPTTTAPTTLAPTTLAPTTLAPTTTAPTTLTPTTLAPTTTAPTSGSNATTATPTTTAPTSGSNATTATPTTTSPPTNPNMTIISSSSSSSGLDNNITFSSSSSSSSSSGLNGNPNVAMIMTPMWGMLFMLVVALLA